jgi:hypothetical protein
MKERETSDQRERSAEGQAISKENLMSKSLWKVMSLAIISVALVPCVAMAQWSGTNLITTTDSTAKVGIGTTPSYDLHIFRNTNGAKALTVQAQNGGANTYADTEMLADNQAFSLRAYSSGFSQFTHAGMSLANMAEFWSDELTPGTSRGLLIGTGGPYVSAAPVIFATNGSERMRITGTSVGIGTTTPAYTLDVVGTIHASNVIGASYQDFAEWVPASEQMTAGTVVVLNREKKNEVLASTSAYDSTVAGVVSAKPGIILGEAAKDKAQIATTGRVRVKVDATRAPIQIGDLLVTSDVAGTAMKSEPIEIQGRRFHQPGTIVGKALEPLSSGKGEILVLLSLQ